MAHIKSEPVDDSAQSIETCFPVVKSEVTEIDDSNFWVSKEKINFVPQELFSNVPVKTGPVDNNLENCLGVTMKKGLAEAERGSELENPLFVTVKEEPYDGTILDEHMFESCASEESPIAETSGLLRDAGCTMVVSHSDSLNCNHHCNSIRTQKVNPEEWIIENRTQCLCTTPLEMRSLTECETQLGIPSTSEVEKAIYEGVNTESKIEKSSEMQMTGMEYDRSVVQNNWSFRKDGEVGCTEKLNCSSLHASSKQIMQTFSDKNTYRCSQCEKTFNTKTQFNRHILTHTGVKAFKCSQCEKTFNTKTQLDRHLLTHTGVKAFKCNQCERAFKHKHHLTSHMRLHTGEMPFKCEQCEKSFNQKCSLTTHMHQHTGVKPHKCKHCGKTFNQSSSLTNHMRKHTGVKPFKCNECGKAFNLNSTLTAHIRQHTGDKPFKCTVCGKAFNQKSNLTTHFRLHTGEKPFKCNRCGKVFSRNAKLIIHMQQHIE